jgi:hypothetical protein
MEKFKYERKEELLRKKKKLGGANCGSKKNKVR